MLWCALEWSCNPRTAALQVFFVAGTSVVWRVLHFTHICLQVRSLVWQQPTSCDELRDDKFAAKADLLLIVLDRHDRFGAKMPSGKLPLTIPMREASG